MRMNEEYTLCRHRIEQEITLNGKFFLPEK